MKYILLALALAVLAAGSWGAFEHQRAKAATVKAAASDEARRSAEKALSKANEQAAILREASLARQQELNRLRVTAAATKEKLDAALKANRDWADAPVPGSVLDALTGPAAPAGQAGPGVDRARAGASAPRP